MVGAFEEAVRRRPDELVVRWLASPAGPIRLTVVGHCLADHLAATLRHLAGAGQRRPALCIDLWDEALTGVPCPLRPDIAAFPRDVNGTPVRVDPANPRRMWTGGEGSVTELDGGAGRMVGWRADASRLSVEERGRPLPVVLQAWLQWRGVVTLHAAAVACAGRAALIVGDSGSGKSTTALACAAAGFGFLGDDQIAVSWPDGAPVAHSLFASARVNPVGYRQQHGAGKALVLLSGPDTILVPSAALAAVIVATVAPDEASTLVRATAKDALRALVPSTLLGVVDDRAAVLRGCARAIIGTATYRLRSGRDLDAVPGLVGRALAEAG